MIKLIVGLANPGEEYQATRHNAGAWFVEKLLQQLDGKPLQRNAKFQAYCSQLTLDHHCFRAVIPDSYMNLSGRVVSYLMNFYKITPEQLLIAHDEIDLPPGVVRLKFSGGEGGHNGLRSIVSSIGSKQFYRLRIGVGRPSGRFTVTNFVLQSPPQSERILIDAAIDDAVAVLPKVFAGDLQKAMTQLHTQ